MTSTVVMGVDACSTGWIGIVEWDGRISAHWAPDIVSLMAEASPDGPLAVVAVDMPIGLADAGRRAPDQLARAIVGPRASSVFPTPARAAIEADTYVEANIRNWDLVGTGVSKQAYGLRKKLLEVNAWANAEPGRVLEMHPEVSFVHLTNGHLPPKRSWAGMHARMSALAAVGFRVPDDLGPIGARVGTDDVIDAAVGAWTARRRTEGFAVSYPDPPIQYSDGWPCAIWA